MTRQEAFEIMYRAIYDEDDEAEVADWLHMEEPPVVTTHETVVNFEAAGWQRESEDSGVVVLTKTTPHPTLPGRRQSATLTILDAGDTRYVHVEH